ncbi:MAG: GTP-binding protein [Pseudomonadota bacterium]|nr:GTP-binding protein [Pseudomonadota bacterium]
MIPLHLVTGFLGAGKTSFLNRLLRDPALKDSLVVVNEFGAAALDHLLYERLDGETRLLASGCLCCELRGDFVDGLLDILVRRQGGFSRVIVETSGLADPSPVLHALFGDDHLAARVRLAGVTTLVDAVNGLDTLERHGEARRQVMLADRVALTKTDLADGGPAAAACAALAPAAEIVEAHALDAAAFLAESQRAPAQYSPRAAHGAAQAHEFRADIPLPPAAFARFLTLLGKLAGPRLLRVKGLVATSDAPDRPWLVQGAQHVYAPPLRLERWPEGASGTALVVIGEGIADLAQRLWDALTGAPAVDAPDWAALTENPLALRGGGLLD